MTDVEAYKVKLDLWCTVNILNIVIIAVLIVADNDNCSVVQTHFHFFQYLGSVPNHQLDTGLGCLE